MESARGLIILALLVSIVTFGLWQKIERPRTGAVETRHEKLIFSSTGCKVYQVTIRNEYGRATIHVAVHPAASKRPTTPYPTCRIAH